MSVLSELRRMLREDADDRLRYAKTEFIATEAAVRIVDAFEAAHPGLKDFTVMCCNCGVLLDDDEAWWAPELFMGEKEAEQVFDTHALDGWSGVHLCPACAKEAS